MRVIGNILKKSARRSDLMMEDLQDSSYVRYVLVCPETGLTGLLKLIEHKRATLQEEIGIPMSFGCAAFPNDAVTFEDLLLVAEYRSAQQPSVTSTVASAQSTIASLGENPIGERFREV
jgi:hypothetical protein